MFAFSNLFYIQLGSVMEDFNDQLASFLSLARALFGDFDIDDIMNNSSGYTNAVLFLIYLFVAVFILLSMFLAILGEAQAAVRMEQDDAVETGTAPPEYGVLYYAKERYDEYKEEFRIWQARRSGKDIPRSAMSPDRMEPERPTDEDLYPELDDQMRDLRKAFNTQMNDIRADIDTVAKQLEGARPAPAEGVDPDAGAHTTALIKRFEEKMNRRMTHMEELLFPRSNMWGKVPVGLPPPPGTRPRRAASWHEPASAPCSPVPLSRARVRWPPPLMWCGTTTGDEGRHASTLGSRTPARRRRRSPAARRGPRPAAHESNDVSDRLFQ